MNKDFEQFYGGYITADNLSLGFHQILFEYMKHYKKKDDIFLLVGENNKVFPVFLKHFPGHYWNYLGYDGNNGEKYDLDLNVSLEFAPSTQFNFVFCQALLEHVCRPSIVIENLRQFTKKDGYIILHTHNFKQPYHAYPIDCCRFYKDFFYDICKYVPLEVIEYNEWEQHIFVVWKRIN